MTTDNQEQQQDDQITLEPAVAEVAAAPAGGTPAPPPDPKMDDYDARLSKLNEAIQNADTGRVRRMLTEERDKLSEERTRYQLRDILTAPERESEPAPDAPRMNETKDGWQIDVPDTFSASLKPLAAEYAEDMGRAAHDAGIPAEEANTLFEFVSQHASQQIEGLNIANEREVIAHMQHKYGATEAAAIVTAAQAAFKQLPKSVQDYLDHPNPDNTRLTNSPSVLLMLALWGSGHTRLTPENATKELARLRASKEYVSGHKLTLEKAHLLQTMISRAKRQGERADATPKAAAKVAPAATSKLEAELKTIRMDKGYWDKSAANHRALTSRVAQIYAELHPEGS